MAEFVPEVDFASKTAKSIHKLIKGEDDWKHGWEAIVEAIEKHDSHRAFEITNVGYLHRRPFNPIGASQAYMLCVLALKSKDGKTDHAVAICNNYLFDTNFANALPLQEKALDYCCSADASEGSFEMVWRGIALKNHKRKRYMSK